MTQSLQCRQRYSKWDHTRIQTNLSRSQTSPDTQWHHSGLGSVPPYLHGHHVQTTTRNDSKHDRNGHPRIGKHTLVTP